MCASLTPLEYLEYDEEDDDLFGSDVEGTGGPSRLPLPAYNPAKPINSKSQPIAGPRTPTSSASVKGKERAVYKDPQDRLDELRFMRIYKEPKGSSRGAKSLKQIAQNVIKHNAPRIWDVGEMEYRLVAFMVNEVPMEQLAEIEGNSPHLRKETDWLWEYHLLKDHPMFYGQCRERHGELRTTGWRRMYKKALENQEKRKTNAVDKLQQRYKELEDQKQARKVVFVDKMTVPTKGKAARGRQGGMVVVKAGQPRSTHSSQQAPKGIFGKAKMEAQRAKVALTHASGHYDPRTANRVVTSTRPRPSPSMSSPFSGIHSSSPAPPVASGPRLPAPRSAPASNKRRREASPPDPLPGARPHVVGRTDLPLGLATTETPKTLPSERFKVDPKRLATIKKPRVENFEPPRPPTATVDLGTSSPNQPTNAFKPLRPLSSAGSIPSRPLNPAEEAAKRNSVLFVKKKPKPGAK